MGKHRIWVQIFILAALVIIGGMAIGQSLFAGNALPREGAKAPGFSLHAMNGETVSLDDLKGKTVVVNFWGTFCPPCKEEMPAMQNQYKQWSDRGVEFLAVNLGESPVTVKSFVNRMELTFPILYDPNLAIRDKYAVNQYPTTFFIDPSGKIRQVKIGKMDEAFIEQTLKGMQL